MKRRTSATVLGCAFLFTLATPHAAGRRFITDSDLLKFTWVADPQISPDGSTVAFVRVTVNAKENRYETSLFAVPTGPTSDAPRRLTASIRDTAPRWAPDGKHLAFVRSIEKDGKTQPGQLYLLAMDGGEARPLTDLPNGTSSAVWSPDGKALAFNASTGPEEKKTEGEPKSDVKVITRAVYRANGNPGYVETETHSHIFTLALSDHAADRPQPKLITDGEFDERDIAWAPDSSTIYFTSTRVPEPYYQPSDSDLYRVPATGGSITKVASIDGTITDVSVSPDGRRLAFIGTLSGDPVRSYSQADLWVVDAVPGAAPEEPHGQLRLRRQRRYRRRSVGAAGTEFDADRLVAGRIVVDGRLRRARQREPEALHDCDRPDRSAHGRSTGGGRVQRDA